MADDILNKNDNNLFCNNAKEKYECELCLDMFNLYDRKPVCLVPCGHSLCIKCFDSLRKNVCPFCRVTYDNKIINWEISKRLPKPTIPIIYYQTQIKLNNLKDLLIEFNQTNSESNLNIKNKIVEFKTKEINRRDKEELELEEKNNGKNQVIVDKLKEFEKTLSENYHEHLESETNLKKVYDTFKSQIDLDENKFSEENLKKMKNEIESVHQYFKEKLNAIKNEDEKIKEILSTSKDQSNMDADGIIKKLQMEIDERKKRVTLTRQLAVLFSHSSATVRPSNQANINTSEPNLNEQGNNTNESDTTGFTRSQKLFIVTLVAVLTIIFMIYPIAMIVMGSIYRDQCTINNLIPIWLIVSGSCSCIIEVLIGIFLVYTILRFFVRKTFKERLLVIVLLLLPFTFLFVFNLAWFFAGNAWIYSVYKTVQYDDKTSQVYCNQQLYIFAFWTLNASYIIIGSIIFAANLICCCLCCLKKES